MVLQKQVSLKNGREPLQVPYPANWQGEKSGEPDDLELYISTVPRFITTDEVPLVEAFLKKLTYPQSLVYTGCVRIDPDDPLLNFSAEELDRVEKEQNLPSTSNAPGGGQRQLIARVLMIREAGYEGNGNRAIGSKS